MCAHAARRIFFELGELAEAETFGDVAARVLAYGKVGNPVGRGDAAIEGARAFGGSGGVFGHVARDRGVSDVAGGGNRADIELAAPRQRAGWEARGGGRPHVDGAGGLVDGGGEYGERSPGRRCGGRTSGAVEPDDGVEVDDATPLILGDLGV
jgi:hypothetical protein